MRYLAASILTAVFFSVSVQAQEPPPSDDGKGNSTTPSPLPLSPSCEFAVSRLSESKNDHGVKLWDGILNDVGSMAFALENPVPPFTLFMLALQDFGPRFSDMLGATVPVMRCLPRYCGGMIDQLDIALANLEQPVLATSRSLRKWEPQEFNKKLQRQVVRDAKLMFGPIKHTFEILGVVYTCLIRPMPYGLEELLFAEFMDTIVETPFRNE